MVKFGDTPTTQESQKSAIGYLPNRNYHAKRDILNFVYFGKWGAQTSSNRNKMYCNCVLACLGYTIVEHHISLSWTGKEIH